MKDKKNKSGDLRGMAKKSGKGVGRKKGPETKIAAVRLTTHQIEEHGINDAWLKDAVQLKIDSMKGNECQNVPKSNLPSWEECQLRVDNSTYLKVNDLTDEAEIEAELKVLNGTASGSIKALELQLKLQIEKEKREREERNARPVYFIGPKKDNQSKFILIDVNLDEGRIYWRQKGAGLVMFSSIEGHTAMKVDIERTFPEGLEEFVRSQSKEAA